jgi:hypothetical protein
MTSKRFLLWSFLLLLTTSTSAFADNNCVSWKCFNPPPYNCPYCDTTWYTAAASCTVGTLGGNGFCVLSGTCDTGMEECYPSAGTRCGPDQQWVRSLEARPLKDEWRLVKVRVEHRPSRHSRG